MPTLPSTHSTPLRAGSIRLRSGQALEGERPDSFETFLTKYDSHNICNQIVCISSGVDRPP